MTNGRTGASPEEQTQTVRTRTETCLRALQHSLRKGITAKPSGTQKNSDSGQLIGPTTKLKGETAKRPGILKTSDPERPVGQTAQPKGTTAKPSGKTAQPKGNTAKPSGIIEHRANKNRPHIEKQNATSEIAHQSNIDTKYDDIYNNKRMPKGSAAKPTGTTAKPSGDHLTPGTPATGQPAATTTAVGEPSAQKRRGETKVSVLNKMNAIAEYFITAHIQILSTDMKNTYSQNLFGH